MIMDSVRDLSKEKDIIRIIGRMPDRVLDKEAAEGTDILDRIYEVHIGTQDNLIEMLQKAGYKVTESDSYTAVIIGQKGANIEKITQKMEKLTTKKVQIKIKEIKKADCNAQLIAQNIAKQIEGRGAYRRAMKNAISRALLGGVEGIKIKCSGRLGGAEIARTEQMKDGRVPLHTLRSDIDYGFATANTSFGSIGIKVWVFNGEIYDRGAKVEEDSTASVGRKGGN